MSGGGGQSFNMYWKGWRSWNEVWSDSKVSCEEWSEEDVKEGEEDCKDDSSDVASGQDGCKDDASDKSQTSDLGVSPDLSINESGDYKKTIPCIIYSFIH